MSAGQQQRKPEGGGSALGAFQNREVFGSLEVWSPRVCTYRVTLPPKRAEGLPRYHLSMILDRNLVYTLACGSSRCARRTCPNMYVRTYIYVWRRDPYIYVGFEPKKNVKHPTTTLTRLPSWQAGKSSSHSLQAKAIAQASQADRPHQSPSQKDQPGTFHSTRQRQKQLIQTGE